jgi:hypothetical protein
VRRGREELGTKDIEELGRWVYRWMVSMGEMRADFGEGRGRTKRKEVDMVADQDVGAGSLTGSVVERLEALDMDRRRRELKRMGSGSDEGTSSVKSFDANDFHDQRGPIPPGRRDSV